MKTVILAFLISPLLGQTTITVNGQLYVPSTTGTVSATLAVTFTVLGPEADAALAGIGVPHGLFHHAAKTSDALHVVGIEIYNPSNTAVTFGSQRIMQEASAQKIPLVSSAAVSSLLSAAVNKDAWQVLMDLSGLSGSTAVMLLATKSIQARPGWALGLSAVQPIITSLSPYLSKRTPATAAITGAMLPASISLGPHTGLSGLAIGRYSGNAGDSISVNFQP